MKIDELLYTERLIIRKAVPKDITRLKQICDSWENKTILEGNEFTEDYIENCIYKGYLPPVPDASRSNYYGMTIQEINGDVIGFMDLYHGYPDSETVWIGMFVIDKKVQGKSYGKEVIQTICNQCKEYGWKAVGLGVYLKNWKGLRFWNNNGFHKITGIYGDKEYSEDSFSIIGLKNELL